MRSQTEGSKRSPTSGPTTSNGKRSGGRFRGGDAGRAYLQEWFKGVGAVG